MADLTLSIPSKVPNLSIRIDGEKVVELTVSKFYELAYLGLDEGRPFEDRVDMIREKFNEQFDTDIDSNAAAIILTNGMNWLEAISGN